MTKSLAKTSVPSSLHKAILELSEQCPHNEFELMVDSVFSRLKTKFVVGETVDITTDKKARKCEIVSVVQKVNLTDNATGSPSSDKENDFSSTDSKGNLDYAYNVKVNGRIVERVPFQVLRRSYELPDRAALKEFLNTHVKKTYDAASSQHWTVKKAEKRKASCSPKTPAKRGRTSSKTKTPVQKNTLDAFVNITRLSTGFKTNAAPSIDVVEVSQKLTTTENPVPSFSSLLPKKTSPSKSPKKVVENKKPTSKKPTPKSKQPVKLPAVVDLTDAAEYQAKLQEKIKLHNMPVNSDTSIDVTDVPQCVTTGENPVSLLETISPKKVMAAPKKAQAPSSTKKTQSSSRATPSKPNCSSSKTTSSKANSSSGRTTPSKAKPLPSKTAPSKNNSSSSTTTLSKAPKANPCKNAMISKVPKDLSAGKKSTPQKPTGKGSPLSKSTIVVDLTDLKHLIKPQNELPDQNSIDVRDVPGSVTTTTNHVLEFEQVSLTKCSPCKSPNKSVESEESTQSVLSETVQLAKSSEIIDLTEDGCKSAKRKESKSKAMKPQKEAQAKNHKKQLEAKKQVKNKSVVAVTPTKSETEILSKQTQKVSKANKTKSPKALKGTKPDSTNGRHQHLVPMKPADTPDKAVSSLPAMGVIIETDVVTNEGHLDTQRSEVQHVVDLTNVMAPPTPEKLKKAGGLKQMTLFDMAKVKPASGACNAVDSFASIMPPTPRIIRKYKKAVLNGNIKAQGTCLSMAAKDLTERQIEALPPEIKPLVEAKVVLLKLKEKMKSMTDDERKEYLKEKQKLAKAKKQVPMKVDDLEVVGCSLLPAPELVKLPDGLPTSCMEDTMFVSQFICCFKDYLKWPEDYSCGDIGFRTLAEYLKDGSCKLEKIAMSLLMTLLDDHTMNEAYEIGVPLSSIPITEDTVSHMLYITLKKVAGKEARAQGESSQLVRVAESIRQYDDLSKATPCVILECLTTLCYLLLDGRGILIYQDKVQETLTKTWRERNQFMKEYLNFRSQHTTSQPAIIADTHQTDQPENGDAEAGDASKEPMNLGEVLRLRREMSRKSLEEKEKKQEEERKARQLQNESDRLEKVKKSFEDKLTVLQRQSKNCLRLAPLGLDRHHCRYWYLPGQPGLYVERGWFGEYYSYTIRSPDTDYSSILDDTETQLKRVPDKVEHCWYYYHGKESVDHLISCLTTQGLRESLLKAKITSLYSSIVPSESPKLTSSTDSESLTGESSLDGSERMTLPEALLDFEDRVRTAGLGGVEDYDKWSEVISSSPSLDDIKSFLLESQSSVYENRRCGIMSCKKDKNNAASTTDKLDNSNEEEPTELTKYIKRWRDAVQEGKTTSELYFLLEILEMCVMWEKSIDKVKCRICRRMGDDASLLLCDGCDLGFHIQCMKLRWKDIPEGQWFCPTCAPREERKSRNSRNLKDLSDSEEEDSEEDSSSEEEEGESCVVCEEKKDEELVICDTCLSSYHLSCHKPSLRVAPSRFAWTCFSCRGGKDKEDKDSKKSKSKTEEKKKAKPLAIHTRKVSVVLSDTLPEVKVKKVTKDSHINSSSSTTKAKTTRSQRHAPSDSDTDDENETTQTRSSRVSCRNATAENTREHSTRGEKSSQQRSVRSSRRNEKLEQIQQDGEKKAKNAGQTSQKASEQTKGLTRNLRKRKPSGEDTNSDLKKSESVTSAKRKRDKQANDEEDEMDFQTPEELKRTLKTLHTKLWNHRTSWPFEYPVDKNEVLDYYDVIDRPMDLTTVQRKIEENKYTRPAQFVKDIDLMILNSYQYNQSHTQVAKTTALYEQFFTSLLPKYFPKFTYNKKHYLAFGVKPK